MQASYQIFRHPSNLIEFYECIAQMVSALEIFLDSNGCQLAVGLIRVSVFPCGVDGCGANRSEERVLGWPCCALGRSHLLEKSINWPSGFRPDTGSFQAFRMLF